MRRISRALAGIARGSPPRIFIRTAASFCISKVQDRRPKSSSTLKRSRHMSVATTSSSLISPNTQRSFQRRKKNGDSFRSQWCATTRATSRWFRPISATSIFTADYIVMWTWSMCRRFLSSVCTWCRSSCPTERRRSPFAPGFTILRASRMRSSWRSKLRVRIMRWFITKRPSWTRGQALLICPRLSSTLRRCGHQRSLRFICVL